MNFLAAAAMLLTSLGATAQEKPLWFVFLVTDNGPRPAEAAELQRMQKAHIDNFDKLFKEGKLIAAGPVGDPAKKKRGIVVLTVPTHADVLAAFQTDPYIQNRIMKVDAHRWLANRRDISTDFPTPITMEENRLVLMTARRKPAPYLLKQHDAYWKENGKPSAQGVFLQAEGFSELLLFHGKDEKSIREKLKRDPLVHLGLATLEIMPLHIAKGVLKP